MSATNRGAVRDEYDFFATPPEAVDALVEHGGLNTLAEAQEVSTANGLFVDLGAGNGNIAVRLKERLGLAAIGIETHEGRAEACRAAGVPCATGDFLSADVLALRDALMAQVRLAADTHEGARPQYLITGGNPPYSNAKAFIERGCIATKAFGEAHLQLPLTALAHVQLLRINYSGFSGVIFTNKYI